MTWKFHWRISGKFHEIYRDKTGTATAFLSCHIIGRPPRGVSRQWMVVVGYGMRHVTGLVYQVEF